jgi:hypothetical protein
MTMLALPLNDTPFIVLAVCKVVAVLALPLMFPEMVFENVSFPENVLVSPKSVELAAVTVSFVSPSVSVWPLRTMVECASPAFESVPEMVGVKRMPFGETAMVSPCVTPFVVSVEVEREIAVPVVVA